RDDQARLRGTLAHRLLQSLPEVRPERRAAMAQSFLARRAREWPAETREQLAASLAALIANPDFAALFAEGSRAEVPVIGRLTRTDGSRLNVSGQIDRLVITAREVLIADFKTEREPPR